MQKASFPYFRAMTNATYQFFQQNLLLWFASNHRPLPWKGERDAYRIWLSEIILQQTTVQQGLPYYEKFVATYPSVFALADAPDDDVMKLWEGLGYYSRARNLHATAKYIAFELNGSFPITYEGLLTLKGVGSYTAAAIASFAFGLPHAVLDGNVFRVLSRFFGIEEPIDTSAAKRIFTELANNVLDKSQPANFNQAMMDFGATHCTPAQPKCTVCLLRPECRAFQLNKVAVLPQKSKKMVRKRRFFNYFILNTGDSVFIKKRTSRDIWQELYEFPMVETLKLIENEADLWQFLKKNAADTEGVGGVLGLNEFKGELILAKKSLPKKQLLTHQEIVAIFWEFDAPSSFDSSDDIFLKIERKNLYKFAFPKIIDLYLQEKVLSLF